MTGPDFSGWATKHNTACADGRTILADAFKDQDGLTVPLVYQHGHTDIGDVLGYVTLEYKPEGVRAHGYFNQSAEGQKAKEMVRHGDIKWLSVFANNLIEKMQGSLKAVVHGNIREVSLVLAGANPGAVIDNVNLVHGDGEFETLSDVATITTGVDLESNVETVSHADTAVVEESATEVEAGDGNELERIMGTLNGEQEVAVNFLLAQALTKGAVAQHSATDEVEDEEGEDESEEGESESGDEGQTESAESGDESEEGESASEEGEGEDESEEGESESGSESEGDGESEEGESESEASSENNEAGDAVQHDTTNQEDNSMTHNLFDQAGKGGATMSHQQTKLSPDEVKALMREVVNGNTTLSAVLKHYAEDKGVSVGGELKHGIENIDYLFPDFKTLSNSPAFISRRMEWVDKVLAAVRKVPFARIKTVTADITADEARARGYITGNMKNEEFFELSKRETTPQTVYKKQKLDRDDVLDIADLDVIAWLKAEMKVMLDEEIASAILFGDGRSSGDEDKIRETNIRPIASDAELYVTTARVNLDDANSTMEELVDQVIMTREFYKGSGQPTFYTTQQYIGKFKLEKDLNGQRRYKSNDDIATQLDVAGVVACETMSRVPDLVGILVNLADYSIGTDRGGQATMFDDFDLDYNKLRYLLETRISGALTTPKAAIVYRKVASGAALVAPNTPAFVADTGVLTVPTQTGVTYKNDAGTTLTTGAPVTVPAGETYHVTAFPASASYYFGTDQADEWTFTADPA